MSETVKRVGILAGGGALPREVATHAREAGIDVHIVAIEGEADVDYSGFPVTFVNWGAIGKMVAALKANNTSEIVIVGRVTRPDLRKIRPDLGFFWNLPRIIRIVRAGGDDSVLRTGIDFFESRGLRVRGVRDIAPDLIIGTGPLGKERAGEDDRGDVVIGFDIIRRLGRFDVGQGVVVTNGVVEAIEGAEGTDRMLERVALLRVTKFSETHRGVLVKRPKPDQELRIDLPTVGPDTAKFAARAGLGGIAVLSGATIAADRKGLITAADESQLFIEGCEDEAADQSDDREFAGDISFVQLGDAKLSRRDDSDLKQAVGVLEAIAPYEIGGAVAVARNHVLAIEVGEGIEAFLHRVKSLRQWGGGVVRDQIGIAVFGSAAPYGTGIVSAAVDAGLKGIIIASGALSNQDWSTAIVNANTKKLFIGALTVAERNRA